MRVDIVIPTHSKHLIMNAEFLASIVKFCDPASVPFIHFITADAADSAQLRMEADMLPPAFKSKIRVMDISAEMKLFDEKREAFDGDEDVSWKSRPKYPLINFKKLSGVEAAFKDGADAALVLDSETQMFRPSKLHDALVKQVNDDRYAYSKAALGPEIISNIQHDSLRSLNPNYDKDHYLAQGYGWFDNLCFYRKENFAGFLKAMGGDTIMDIFPNCRGYSFEWIMYNAYEIWSGARKVTPVDMDKIIEQVTGRPAEPHPQAEALYFYITGNPDKDGELLAKLAPPWVPASESPYILNLLKKYTPDSCCLMFHKDREHSGRQMAIPRQAP